MEAAGPVKEQVAQVVQEVKEGLQEPAQQAVENVKQSASQAAPGELPCPERDNLAEAVRDPRADGSRGGGRDVSVQV